MYARCNCCGKTFSKSQYLALPKPPYGDVQSFDGIGPDLRLRNCSCGSTITAPIQSTIPPAVEVRRETLLRQLVGKSGALAKVAKRRVEAWERWHFKTTPSKCANAWGWLLAWDQIYHELIRLGATL